ncbi:hypothetical protein GQX73_g7550 [Xylaria multiplex]|uniref:DUF967 domain protein n=1 Tax=Xylaria multiplex TaxID=323545 RepID=A0A7C8IQZ0_9PEZI|nr:hypothetical protein GQX73_g7550 [Xylaria multiplex]
MSPKILSRKDKSAGVGLRAVLAAQGEGATAAPIPSPPNDPEVVKATSDFTLDSFTASDAWELGHLLYARLLPFSAEKPTLISIASANSEHVLFQAAVGSGTAPDNDNWVQRKRNAVLRFAASTWFLQCKYQGDERAFRLKFGMSEDVAGRYAIHGGGVPIRVSGVEGIVAVVVVSGLKQHEDHGVIVDVINSNWE